MSATKTASTIEELKADILQSRGEFGYVVPIGFLDEFMDTSLHIALRELRNEGRIVGGPYRELGYESWVPASDDQA